MEQQRLDFATGAVATPTPRRAVSVSQLTERIQGLLETEFVDVWIEGEVSNLTRAASGHYYFSLKDERAQIRAIIWKTAARRLRFKPRDGLKVVVRGQVRVYAPRGEYQVQVEVLEPLGKGSLQQAFEDLKERLQKEGLFDPARKRLLPMLPRRVGIVTSPTGAVLRDILRVLAGRYTNLDVLLYPARVQGPEAAREIVKGIQILGLLEDDGVDVIILARGGGSLEDLWPFNEESVARALAVCPIPTIAAVGHETDFTIADFVADLRAATPSAAAERVVQAKHELKARVTALARQAEAALHLSLTRVRARVQALTSHRVFAAEQGRLRNNTQKTDELARRADRALRARLTRARERLVGADRRVNAFRWERQVERKRSRAADQRARLDGVMRAAHQGRRDRLARATGLLESLSPLAVLSRGYALAFTPAGRLVRSPDNVEVGDDLALRVHGGQFSARVTSKEPA